MKKTRITLTERELMYLEHILYHFTDYMAYDDRPDHGLGILKRYRTMKDEDKHLLYRLAEKLRKHYRKLILRKESVSLQNGTLQE
jgi:hypothetical protein